MPAGTTKRFGKRFAGDSGLRKNQKEQAFRSNRSSDRMCCGQVYRPGWEADCETTCDVLPEVMEKAVDSGKTEKVDYLNGLNNDQRRAVEYGEVHGSLPGPLLVIAGAGSGKTNTLAHRVAHLIVQGADPRRILLMTCLLYTSDAADD